MNSAAWAWVCDRGEDDRLFPGPHDPESTEAHLNRWQSAMRQWADRRTPPPPADPPPTPTTPDEGPDWRLIDGFTRVAQAALSMAATAARLGHLESLPDRLDHVAADVAKIREDTELSGA